MALLSANNLSQSFGAEDIFAGISLSVPDGGKIGLVGANGIGKTTLLLVLAGQAQPSSGELQLAKNCKIGYLPQEAAQAFAGNNHTVYQEMLAVYAELRQQEAQLRQLEAKMEAQGGDESLFEQYGALLERFEFAGGYQYETHIKQTLDGLGFDRDSRHLPLTHLSGGQKTRALLARLLLERPDLLILDEPTNHLDIKAVEWLENSLKQWDGAILIVSHDRYFLDKVTNRIWEMGRGYLETYRGNYTHYLQQRQERWELRQNEFDAFKARMEKELDYIRKHIASQNTNQAKGKLKRISRELKAVRVGGLAAVQGKSWAQTMNEIDISSADWRVADAAQAINELRPPSGRPPQLNFRLTSASRSGDIVLRTADLEIGYPGSPLFTAEDIELWRGECAALIGGNGSGKTTFLRTVLELIKPLKGEIRLGASLKLGYFAQAHESLNPQNQVLDELMTHHPMLVSEARNYLAKYLFREDDVYKLVADLSGGERGRLALAILALEGANLLLLDEPTNHLDIPAQESLQQTLEAFAGTILLVSHDRYLIDRLATQIWSLQDGALTVFQGGYQAYLNHLMPPPQQKSAKTPPPPSRPPIVNGSPMSKNRQRRQQEALAALEARIQTAESRLADLTNEMQQATFSQNFDKIQRVGIEYAQTETDLETLMKEWEEIASEQR